MGILDSLNEESLARLAKQTVKPGDVYQITMTEENGIRPKPGDLSRDKYFIVLGFDEEGNIYGGVIINSKINQNLPTHLKMFHMPIKQTKYPFLRYDSFVDCVRLKVASLTKFNEWSYLGEMDESDLQLIIGTIKESPVEIPQRLSQFGL